MDNGDTLFTEQQIAIRTLAATIQKLNQIYEYYKERTLVEKAQAVLYEMEMKDHLQALVHVHGARKYEHAKEVISNLQIKFIDIQVNMKLLVNTSESLELMQKYSIVLKNQLDTINKETNVKRTLEVIERQMQRIETMDDLISDSAASMTVTSPALPSSAPKLSSNIKDVISKSSNENDVLQEWCKSPKPIFETMVLSVPGAQVDDLHTFLPLIDQKPKPNLPTTMIQSVQSFINYLSADNERTLVPNDDDDAIVI